MSDLKEKYKFEEYLCYQLKEENTCLNIQVEEAKRIEEEHKCKIQKK